MYLALAQVVQYLRMLLQVTSGDKPLATLQTYFCILCQIMRQIFTEWNKPRYQKDLCSVTTRSPLALAHVQFFVSKNSLDKTVYGKQRASSFSLTIYVQLCYTPYCLLPTSAPDLCIIDILVEFFFLLPFSDSKHMFSLGKWNVSNLYNENIWYKAFDGYE